MNTNAFIHYFLIAALCVGQFSGMVHMAEHVHDAAFDSAQESEHESGHESGHEHASHVEHRHSAPLLSIAESGAEELSSECGIYHAYMGLSGGLPTACTSTVQRTHSDLLVTDNRFVLLAQRRDSALIRAPPQTS